MWEVRSKRYYFNSDLSLPGYPQLRVCRYKDPADSAHNKVTSMAIYDNDDGRFQKLGQAGETSPCSQGPVLKSLRLMTPSKEAPKQGGGEGA